MKIAFVVNPASGRKFQKKVITDIRRSLQTIHNLVDFEAQTDQEIDLVSHQIHSGFDLIIVCGGDGTVSRVSHFLINNETPLLVIPIGSGNDFANHLQMKCDIDDIHKNINRFNTVNINTIEISNGLHHSLTITCFAFEAKVNRIASMLPRFIGGLKYTIGTFISLLGRSYETVKIESNNIDETGSYSLAILANSPSFGGGMMISNKANVYAENLFLILVNRVNKIKLIYLFLLLLAGKHYSRPEFRQFPIQNLAVQSVDRPIKAQADGDSITEGNFSAKILPKSLKVLDCR